MEAGKKNLIHEIKKSQRQDLSFPRSHLDPTLIALLVILFTLVLGCSSLVIYLYKIDALF